MSTIQAHIDQRSLRDTLSNLGRISKVVEKKVKDEIVYTTLEIERDAVFKCPYITGRLAGSSEHQFKRNRLGGIVKFTANYASIVENGVPGKRRPKPYLGPAYFENIGPLKERIQTILKNPK